MDAYQAKFLRPTMKHPAKLMVWGSIGNGKLGRLHILPRNTRMNSDLYQDILRKHLRPSMTMTGTTIFQQDGATCHTSRQMMNWFAQQDITLLDWPGQSPNMNPSENLWTAFKRLLYQKFKPPSVSWRHQLLLPALRGWASSPVLNGQTLLLPLRWVWR